MSTITYENIKINGVPFSQLLELRIDHAPDKHGTAHIVGQAPFAAAQEFMQRVDETFAIDITTTADQQPTQLFYGVISNVVQNQENDFATLTIDAKTTTALLDITSKNKTFQRTSQTYGQLLNQVIAGQGTVNLIVTDKVTGTFIIQTNETNWKFIVRMASALGAPACANIIAKEPYIYVGPPPASDTRHLKSVEYQSGKSISSYASFSANSGGSALAEDFGGDTIFSYDYAYMGDILDFNGKILHVKEVHAVLTDGILSCNYLVGKKTSFITPPVTNVNVSGKMMTGIVQAVQKDTVQVHFSSVDSSYDGGSETWFPYSTAYSSSDGSGWYSMPAAGDEVRVFFPSANEKDAFAASSTQKNPGAKVTDKVWSGPNGKQILLTDEGLMIIGSAGKIFISLMDATGIEIISDKNISITSAANVSIQAGDAVNILAENHIIIGTQEAYLDIRNEGVTMTAETILLT